MNDAIFVPKSSVKEVVFSGGGSKLRISFKVAELIAFAKEHQNEKGYINLNCSRRKTIGEYGDTHTLMLDTWKPRQSTNRSQPRNNNAPQRQPTASTHENKAPEDDDVPF